MAYIDSKQGIRDFYAISSQTRLLSADGDVLAGELDKTTHLVLLPKSEAGTSVIEDDLPRTICDSTRLFGINEQAPFFTSAQVFQTTTGLRAVDPSIARVMLPGVDIGPLRAGHVLYRLRDDLQTYEELPLNQLRSSHGHCERSIVYIHRGPSTYYANRFIMLSLQPDFSSQSVGKILAKLSYRDQIACLRGLDELTPMFRQIGSQGMGILLEKELEQKTYLAPQEPRRFVSNAQPLSYAKRTYCLSCRNGDTLEPVGLQYDLPEVSIFEGVVSINGRPEIRAEIENPTRSVRWSRKLSQQYFEHGWISMFEHNLAGSGVILISENSDETVMPEGDCHFLARIFARHAPSKLPKAERQLADGVEDHYQMIMDIDPWPKEEESRDQPKDPDTFGLMAFDTVNIGGDDGLEAPIVKIPVLDDLCQAINNVYNGDGAGNITSLYNSTLNLTGRSDSEAIVTLSKASLIYSLADSISLEQPFHLTFQKNLGSDLVLPILFQEFRVKLTREGTLNGTIYGYRPDMRGCMGERHLFISNSAETVETIRLRSVTSSVIASSIQPGNGHVSRPAPVTKVLETLRPRCVEDLMLMDGYNEPTIHETTQTLLKNAMLYHMDAADRVNILNQNQPSVPRDLPYRLARGLEVKHQNWLKNTYAPAFICSQLATYSDAQTATWGQYKLNTDEKHKLVYFWSGKGKSCLSKQKEYTDLTELAAKCALEILCPRIKEYTEDGEFWAEKVTECLANPVCVRSLQETPVEGGVNYANKFANVITYLDIYGRYTDNFLVSAVSHNVDQLFHAPPISAESSGSEAAHDAENFLVDSFQMLGVQVLDNDSDTPIDPALRQQLLEDITSLETESGLEPVGSSDDRMKALVQKQSGYFKELSQHLVTDDATQMNGWAGSESNMPNGRYGFSFLKEKFVSFAKSPSNLGRNNINDKFNGIMLIASAGFFLYQEYTLFTTWDDSDEVVSAANIMGILSSIEGLVASFPDVWEAFKVSTTVLTLSALVKGDILSSLVRAATNAELLSTVLKTVTSGNKFATAVSEALSTCGLPKQITGSGSFMDTITSKIHNIQDSFAGAAAKVNIADTVLNAAFVLLNVAVVISMSLQLREQWNSMDAFDRSMSVLQIAITGVQVIFAGVLLGAQIAVFAGVAVADSIIALLPIAGQIAAAIGLVMAFIAWLVDLLRPSEPPPLNPFQIFIRDKGRPLIASWLNSPKRKLSYNIPSTVSDRHANPTSFTIIAENNTDQIVTLGKITFTFTTGCIPSCLFTNDTFDVVDIKDEDKDTDGTIYIGFLSDNVRANINIDSSDNWTTSFAVGIVGVSTPANEQGLLKLWPRSAFSLTITGEMELKSETIVRVVEDFLKPSNSSYRYYTVAAQQSSGKLHARTQY